MCRRHSFLVLLVLLTGCSSAPGGTPTAPAEPPADVEVSFSNAANATYDMEVLLLPRAADRARVTFENGSTAEVGNLSAVVGVGPYGPVVDDGADPAAVEPIDVEPLDTRVYRNVGPRSSVSSAFESPPRGAALFVVVTARDGVDLWATATCVEDAAPNAFDVEVRDVGPGFSVGCESFDADTRGTARTERLSHRSGPLRTVGVTGSPRCGRRPPRACRPRGRRRR